MRKNAIKSFFPELDYIRYKPIMWGYSPTKSIQFNKKQKKVLNILHASTHKPIFATRPWIFETSDEFYEGIKELIEVTSKIENVYLTIRLRFMPECNLKWIQNLVINVNNVTIKSDGLFIDDLVNSDLLISNPSTTIEEAIAFNTNVLLWGYGARYSHTQKYTHEEMLNNKTIGCPDKEILRDEIINLRNDKLDSYNNDASLSKEFEVKSGVDDFVKFTLKNGNIL